MNIFRQGVTVALLSAVVGTLVSLPAVTGEPDLGVEIVNDTDERIEHLFLRPADSRLYGGDVLSMREAVEPGESITAGISMSFSETLFSIMAIGEGEHVYEKQNIRVSVGDSQRQPVAINIADRNADAEAPELASMDVAAVYGTDIYYLYLERMDSRDAGANLTGGELLHEGSSGSVRYIEAEADRLPNLTAIDRFGASFRIDGPGN